jgi:hypothetical protein
VSRAPVQLFSHRFPGTIWNTLAVEAENQLVLEVRDDVNFKVTFSLLDFAKSEFVWKDISVPESWWVSLAAVNKSTVLLNRFMNKGGNPDHKSLIALDADTATIRWEMEELSLYDWNDSEILGYSTKDDLVPVKVNLHTGHLVEESWQPKTESILIENPKPVFYAEGTPHFETVKKFVAQTDYAIIKGVEYLEFNGWIIVSVYVEELAKLANYLLVFDEAGALGLTVKLGEKLTGLGTDTFFILSGCLFLVQNKTDLVAYRL